MSERETAISRIHNAPPRRRVVDLFLPRSPMFGYDSDYEIGLIGDPDAPSPPWSAASASGFSLSRFSDDSSEGPSCLTSLRSTFEDWDDFPSTGAEVTIDWDGSQLVHIPYESPFFCSPLHSQASEFPLSACDPSSTSSSSSASSSPYSMSSASTSTLSVPQRIRRAPPILIITNKSDVEDSEPTTHVNPPPSKTMLFVDTTILSSYNSTAASPSPALSAASWYFSGEHDQTSFPWESEGNRDSILDVPCSAVSPVGPMDIWHEDRDGDLSNYGKPANSDP